MPSDAQSAYSLLRAAIQDPDPVVVLEPRILYAERGEVETGKIAEIGKASMRTTGSDITIVALGHMVNIAQDAIQSAGVSADLIDLQTIIPWDRETVLASVKKTGRLIVVEEAPLSGGWGSEIVATVSAQLFSSLKSAPFRITTPDVPVPFNGGLEARYAPTSDDVARQIKHALSQSGAPEPWWVVEGVSR
jgi:pyruvate dehydrogenase E1 component beta subunit